MARWGWGLDRTAQDDASGHDFDNYICHREDTRTMLAVLGAGFGDDADPDDCAHDLQSSSSLSHAAAASRKVGETPIHHSAACCSSVVNTAASLLLDEHGTTVDATSERLVTPPLHKPGLFQAHTREKTVVLGD